MSHKKKVGSAGRFGARYGRKIRAMITEIESVQKAKHKCPFCAKTGGVKRLSPGIWLCKKCESKFAGKAYSPEIKEAQSN